MDQYNLTISIFSKDINLEKVILDIKPLDNFSHQIKRYEKINNKAILSSNIVIYDLKEELDIKRINKKAKVIACCENYNESQENMDGIFFKPFDYKYIKYFLKKILEAIKYEEDIKRKENYIKVISNIGINDDVTDYKKIDVEKGILLNNIPYAILISDNNNRIQTVNSYFETYFGISKEKIIGTLYNDWEDNTLSKNSVLNKEGFIENSFNINGTIKRIELRNNNIFDIFGNKIGHIYVYRDITIQKQLELQLLENSNVDYMTKLYNRRYLDTFIQNLNKGIIITLFSIDLDNFKSINDTYGHKAGDEAIILTARLLKEKFKNDLLVRMGGDEFLIVIIGNYNRKKIDSDAQNILNTLNQEYNKTLEFKELSASIGISQDTLKENNFEDILKKSDNSLYQAKKKGRNCYIYN